MDPVGSGRSKVQVSSLMPWAARPRTFSNRSPLHQSLLSHPLKTVFPNGVLFTNVPVSINEYSNLGEKAETFIRALSELSEHCDFDANRDQHIQNQSVVGILDKGLCPTLELMADLTLATTVRQSEKVRTQVSQQGEAACYVQEIARGHKKIAKRRNENRDSKDTESAEGKCRRCGKM